MNQLEGNCWWQDALGQGVPCVCAVIEAVQVSRVPGEGDQMEGECAQLRRGARE